MNYVKMYPKASEFLNNLNETSQLKALLERLEDKDWDTIRDALADFAVEVVEEQTVIEL